MFYNSLFMVVPSFLVAYNTGDVDRAILFDGWADPYFVLQFTLSCIFGFILVRIVIIT